MKRWLPFGFAAILVSALAIAQNSGAPADPPPSDRTNAPPESAPPATPPPAPGEAPEAEQPMEVYRTLDEVPPERMAVAAAQLLRNNQSREALILLERRLHETPDDRGAISILAALIAQEPTNINALLLSGENGLERNEAELARQAFRQVLSIDPNNYRANLGLGRVYLISRVWRQAMNYFETAQRVAPAEQRPEVSRWLALAYSGSGNNTRALETALEASRIKPDDADALGVLAEVYSKMGEREKALESVRRLVDVLRQQRAERMASKLRLERLMRALDLLVEAMRSYHISMYETDTRNQATDRLLSGRERDAAAILREIAWTMDERARLQVEVVWHNTLPLLDRAYRYQPADADVGWDLALALRATFNIEEEVRVLQNILKHDENHAQARARLAELNAPVSPANETEPPADGNR